MREALPAGVIASSVTPFDPHGSLLPNRIRPHIDWLIAEGANALSPLGSSGEFTALELDGRKRVLDAALEACGGRVPVWAGVHHYSTRLTVELARHAEAAGADALLIVPPYYMAPSVSQAMDHYRRIAASVSLPIVVYHNVSFTKVDFRTSHLMTLFEEKVIAGVKMSHTDPDRICQLLQASGGTLAVYCGIDSVAFEGLCHGARGWISGIPSIVPRAARRLYDAIAASDLASARLLWNPISRLVRLQFDAYLSGGEGAHWFSVMKAALNMIGPPVGDPEPPLAPLEPRYRPILAGLLRELGYQVREDADR